MKSVNLLIIFLSVFLTAAIQVAEECDSTALKKELKEKLKPDFKYDSSKTSRFYYKTKPQIKEIEIPLYGGEKYRFLFNTSGVKKEGVKIEIYSKPAGHKKRELLYSLNEKSGQHIYSYEPDKSRKMYVTYSIPSVENIDETKDCIVFVLGYQLKISL